MWFLTVLRKVGISGAVGPSGARAISLPKRKLRSGGGSVAGPRVPSYTFTEETARFERKTVMGTTRILLRADHRLDRLRWP